MNFETDYKGIFLPPIPSRELPVKVLQQPNQKERLELFTIINGMTVAFIKDVAMMLLYLQNRYTFREQTEDARFIPCKAIEAFNSSGNRLKGEWVELMVLFCHKPNFRIVFETFTPQFRTLWTELTRQAYVSVERMNEIFGKQCVEKGRFLYKRIQLVKPFNTIFQLNDLSTFYDEDVQLSSLFVSFTNPLHQVLFSRITPDAETDGRKRMKQLPENEPLHIYEAEGCLMDYMDILPYALKAAGISKVKNQPTPSALKKLADMILVPEFFDYLPQNAALRGNEKLTLSKAIISTMNICENIRGDLFNQLFICISKGYFTDRNLLLPFIKGVKLNSSKFYRTQDIVKRLDKLLCSCHTDEWVPVKWIEHELQTAGQLPTSGNEVEYPFQIYQIVSADEWKHSTMKNGFSHEEITPDGFMKHIGDSVVLSSLALMALCGLIEVAYTEPPQGAASPFSGFRYVRINDLFLHLHGKLPHYQRKQKGRTEISASFTLDENRLLIHIQDKDSPYIPILNTMTEQVSHSLLRMDFRTLFKSCTKPSAATECIKMFRQIAGPTMPARWEYFLAQAERRARAIKKLKEEYLMLTVPKSDKQLQHLLLSQPELRQFIVKAEGHNVLLKMDDVPAFTRALRKFGYIL